MIPPRGTRLQKALGGAHLGNTAMGDGVVMWLAVLQAGTILAAGSR
jgi:hypothetical protein